VFHSVVMSVTRSNAVFASKHSLMTVVPDGGDSGVYTRCLLHWFWFVCLRSFLTGNITVLTWLSVKRD
jgi:hypothetical protein